MNPTKRHRSSISGRFVKAADAFRHPESTVTERDWSRRDSAGRLACPACDGKGWIARSEVIDVPIDD